MASVTYRIGIEIRLTDQIILSSTPQSYPKEENNENTGKCQGVTFI